LSGDASFIANMLPNGALIGGEVEDYLVRVMGFDYGDLNDNGAGTATAATGSPANHNTLSADSGPSHKIITDATGNVLLKIGATVDDETNGQPSATAGRLGGGDDASGAPDDEDGLDYAAMPNFIVTQTTTLNVPVMNMSGQPAKLVGWIDFNKDGDFLDAGEMVSVNVPDNTNGNVTLSIPVPAPPTAAVGEYVGLRLRLAYSSEAMTSTGQLNSGEVEDYEVQIIGFDFGDLPDTYNTNGNDNPPKHIVSANLKLGASVDSEMDGIPDAMAGLMGGGDDGDAGLVTFGTSTPAGDDENGVMLTTPMIPGSTATIMVDAMNMTGSAAVLQAWVDFNGSGTFEAGEQLTFTNVNGGAVPSPAGLSGAKLTFAVPANAMFTDGNAHVRFRLSPAGGLAPDSQTDPVPFGEIEDYKFPLGKVGNLVWEDRNFDGLQQAGEPGINGATVTLTWLGLDGAVGGGDDVTYPVATTDANGKYYFCGLADGPGASDNQFKLAFTSPTNMTPTRPNQGSQVNGGTLDADGTITGMDLSMAMETFVFTLPTPTAENGTGDNGTNPSGTFPDAQTDETHDQGFAFLDYGDLPETGNGDNFNSTMAEGGAVHVIIPGFKLGASVDGERDATPNATASGDDVTNTGAADDEDGIVFATPLIPNNNATVTVTAMNMTGAPAVLQAWIDWDNSGTLSAGEALTFTNGGIVPAGGVTNAPFTFPVPAGAIFNDGMVFARFRLSPTGGLTADGPDKYGVLAVPQGEVEDYKLNVGKIGNFVWEDYNFDGIQDVGEPKIDGAVVTLVWAGPNNVIGGGDDVNYLPLTTGSGTFDDGEYYYCGLIPGTYKLIYASPTDMTPTKPDQGSQVNGGTLDSDGSVTGMDVTMAMETFTIANVTTLPTAENGIGDNGVAPTGTFPDNQTDETHDQGFAFLDYGDLPNSGYPGINYHTTMAEGGPIHVIRPGLKLGNSVDGEQDASIPDAFAVGDDLDGGDDEDGIVFPVNLVLAPGGNFTINVTAMNMTGAPAVLQGWIDWDSDGILEASEALVLPVVPNGVGLTYAPVNIPIPANANFNMCMMYARFRLSPTGGLGPDGPSKYGPAPVPQGEVEDHKRAIDIKAPTIICPANIVRNTDPNFCSAVVTYPAPFASDDCGPWSLVRTSGLPSGSAFPKGVTMVNWKVTDAVGYMAICGFTVTVNDNQAPSITCPVNVNKWTSTGQCTAPVFYAVKGLSDNCPGVTSMVQSGLPSGSNFPKGTTTIELKATDASGLMKTCSFTVKVSDGQVPSITCPANLAKNTDAIACTAVTTYPQSAALDNCGNPSVSIVSGLPSGGTFPKGVTTVVWKATDGAGLTKTCSFRVTVNDAQAPVIVCTANIAVNSPANQCGAPIAYANATFTDNCAGGTVTRISGLASGATFPVGVTNVVFRATDASGNIATCLTRVTVTDAQAPGITCPANIVRNNDLNLCCATIAYATPAATDNCPGVNVSLLSGFASHSVFELGTSNVVWKATDGAGNSTTCSFSVTINDTQPPMVMCPGNTTVNGSGTPCGFASANLLSANVMMENCPGFTLTSNAPVILAGGVTQITWTAKDAANNVSICSYSVTVSCTTTPWGGGGNGQSRAISVSDNTLDLLIAPNPVTSEVTFRFEGVGEKGGDLTLFDQLGRMVWQQSVTAEQTQVALDVNRSNFASGVYQVRLRTEYGMVTKGLVVNKL